MHRVSYCRERKAWDSNPHGLSHPQLASNEPAFQFAYLPSTRQVCVAYYTTPRARVSLRGHGIRTRISCLVRPAGFEPAIIPYQGIAFTKLGYGRFTSALPIELQGWIRTTVSGLRRSGGIRTPSPEGTGLQPAAALHLYRTPRAELSSQLRRATSSPIAN